MEQTDPFIGFVDSNGIKIYYEIHGAGQPLVLLHGGGSTIETTFGIVLPLFAKHRKVIAVELQAHGHTADRKTATSFEQDADDVSAVLKELQIEKADIFGFSNGGNTAMQLAIRHPSLVRKLVIASTFYKRNAFDDMFWTFMQGASLDNMPQQLKDAYLAINADQEGLIAMHNRDRDRMVNFTDWPDEVIRSIHVPTLIVSADRDVVSPEHQIEMYRLLPKAELVILPGVHGEYIGEITTPKPTNERIALTVNLIEEFLDGNCMN